MSDALDSWASKITSDSTLLVSSYLQLLQTDIKLSHRPVVYFISSSFRRMSEEPNAPPLPFFRDEIGPRLKPQTRALFEQYSNIPPEDVEPHLYDIRHRAWSLHKYPCIGQWVFLLPRMLQSPWYPAILHRLLQQQSSSILDIGCCFGQDLRFLAAAGVPSDRMRASDIEASFWDLGFDLFRDRESFKARFIQANILDKESPLAVVRGKVDILLANQVFHLFNRERQVAMAKNIVGLGSRDAWVVGWQVGSSHGRALPIDTQTGGHSGSAGSDTRLFHNDRTWQELWQEVGEATGTEWAVETSMQPLEAWGYEKEDTAWMGPGAVGFEYICRRVG
ncbi:MAG: hypothetical protein Q9168_003940 [Polycauliona sp. 1 TL-2023]